MARRGQRESSTTTTESPEEGTVTVTDESPVEEAATEAPAEATSTESTESTEASAEVDLTAFNQAVEAAISEHDNSTGTVPEASVAPVTQAYRDLDGVKAKNAAKREVEKLMREAMEAMNIGLARAYMVLSDNLTAGAASKSEKAPADPTEAYVQRVAGLRLALGLVVVPEGVAEDADEKAEALVVEVREQAEGYQSWLASDAEDKGDEPEVPAWVKAAVKLAQGKAAKVGGSTTRSGGSSYSGERRDIGEHIRQAFESKEEGEFLTIAEIRAFKSTEYPNADASAGAISARLFPKGNAKCTLDFVVPDTNEAGRKGARKA